MTILRPYLSAPPFRTSSQGSARRAPPFKTLSPTPEPLPRRYGNDARDDVRSDRHDAESVVAVTSAPAPLRGPQAPDSPHSPARAVFALAFIVKATHPPLS